MSDRKLISLDLETTGTDINLHEAWEVALVMEDGDYWHGEFPVDLTNADPTALKIGDFYNRAAQAIGTQYRLEKPEQVKASEIARYTVDACLMGCAVSFDMKFLEKLLLKYGYKAAWHHRGLDLGSYATGCMGTKMPWSSHEMQLRCPNDAAHTALGDAQWNWSAYHWFTQQRRELK